MKATETPERNLTKSTPKQNTGLSRKKGLCIYIYTFFKQSLFNGHWKRSHENTNSFSKTKPLLEVPNLTFLKGGFFLNNENLHPFSPSSKKPTHRKIHVFVGLLGEKCNHNHPNPNPNPIFFGYQGTYFVLQMDHLSNVPRRSHDAPGNPPWRWSHRPARRAESGSTPRRGDPIHESCLVSQRTPPPTYQ